MQRGHVRSLDLLGRDSSAMTVGKIEAIAGVGHEDHVPAHVGAGSDSGRDAHVGRDAERHDMLRAKPLQPKIEVGADEGRIDALGDERLITFGPKPGRKSLPGAPGASVEPGSIESWRTWMIGRPAARHWSISARPLASIASFQRRASAGRRSPAACRWEAGRRGRGRGSCALVSEGAPRRSQKDLRGS